jgi:tyrosyl-tRNA synthetase
MTKDYKAAFDLIKENTEEIVSEEELLNLLKSGREVKAYWGTAPTGRVHIGYLIPMSKIADFLNVGITFKVLLADIHAHLDDQKSPFELLDARTEYYKEIIIGLLEGLEVDISKLIFERGRDFELTEKYGMDLLRMTSIITLNRARRAGAEVVRQKEDPKLGSFIYPLMQSLDVPHLDCDIAYGGIDQRGIYMLSREILPKIGYGKPVCVFTPLLPGLTGDKMSASDTASVIDCLDGKKQIKKKMNKAYCPEKEVEGNGILAFVKTVIFPYLKRKEEKFLIDRPEKFGGPLTYDSYESMEKAFVAGDLHPLDLKMGMADYVNTILEPLRKRFENKQDLIAKAYGK